MDVLLALLDHTFGPQALRWWTCGQFAETPEVLGDGGEGELELRAMRSAQPEAIKSQNALEMSKQHLDLFAVTAGLHIIISFSNGTCYIAGLFMDIARYLAMRRKRTTLRLQRA